MAVSQKVVTIRTFYSNAYLYFVLALVVTVLGFFPSYFKKLDTTDAMHHFHGVSAMLWMVLLIVQPLVYRLGALRWHRRIGKASFILVPLVIISALNMVQIMILRKAEYPPLLPYQLAFIDIFTLLMFLGFFILAIVHRRNIQLHARYMACTIFGPLVPAIGRLLFNIPWVNNFDKSLNITYIIIEMALIILILDDKRSGKIRNPYVIAFVLFIVQHLMMNFASQWAWWRNTVDSIVSMAG